MSKNTKKKNNWSIYYQPYNNNFKKPEKNIINLKRETIFEEFFENDKEYNLNDLFKKVKIAEDKMENYYIRFHDLECEGTGGFFSIIEEHKIEYENKDYDKQLKQWEENEEKHKKILKEWKEWKKQEEEKKLQKEIEKAKDFLQKHSVKINIL